MKPNEAMRALPIEDEAAYGQDKIRSSLSKMKGKRTVIIIAHRLSSIVDADRILYVQDGSILAQGKHNELIESCEEYRRLYEKEEIRRQAP